jgi:hypothetical protein
MGEKSSGFACALGTDTGILFSKEHAGRVT